MPLSGTVVVDPLDGSTNATLGLPWFATSLCLVVDGVPAVSMVSNLATGEWFQAIAGRRSDVECRAAGHPIGGRRSTTRSSPSADFPPTTSGGGSSGRWGHRRSTSVPWLAARSMAFADLSVDAHGVWDYAGAMLVVQEAGGVIVDALGRDLIVLDHDARRTPVAATSQGLLDDLLAQRRAT